MKDINLILWCAGVTLQILLLGVLWLRGLLRRFPVFTTLIVFFIVRSVALFGLFGHVSRGAYASLYDALSLADVGLQILVGAEIAFGLLRAQSGRRRGATALGLYVGAVAIAAAAAAVMPIRGPAPTDRGSAFASVLLLLVCVWGIAVRVGGAIRRLAAGFAVYSGVALVAAVERNSAALHHRPGAYQAGAYAQSGAYIAVVLFWIWAFWAAKAGIRNGTAAENGPRPDGQTA